MNKQPRITNQDFLNHIFKDDIDKVVVGTMPEHIGVASTKTKALTEDGVEHLLRDHTRENYFRVCTYHEPLKRHVKANSASLYVIMLDDVGEQKLNKRTGKSITVKELPLTPSYIIETSENNYQYGFILSEPVPTDSELITTLTKKLIKGGYTDPNGFNPTRLARLPIGSNLKKGKNGFETKLDTFNPNVSYTINQLIDCIPISDSFDDNVILADEPASITADELNKILLIPVYKKENTGWFSIRCINYFNHTDKSTRGTGVFITQSGKIAYKCMHDNCVHITTTKFNQWLKDNRNDAKRRLSSLIRLKELTHESSTKYKNELDQISNLAIPKKYTGSKDELDVFEGLSKLNDKSMLRQHKVIEEYSKINGISTLATKAVYEEVIYLKTLDKDILANYFYSIADRKYRSKNKMDQFFSEKELLLTLNHSGIRNPKLALNDLESYEECDVDPSQPQVFTRNGAKCFNLWKTPEDKKPALDMNVTEDDIYPYLNLFKRLQIEQHQTAILDFLSYSIQKPESKIEFMLLLGGAGRIGKDTLLRPLSRYFACTPVYSESLVNDRFNLYLYGKKIIHLDELYIKSKSKASKAFNNIIKPLIAKQPDRMYLEGKGTNQISVKKIANVISTTNYRIPANIETSADMARIFPIWSPTFREDLSQRCYAEEAAEWLDIKENYLKVISYLSKRKIVNFSPNHVPYITEWSKQWSDMCKGTSEQVLSYLVKEKYGKFTYDVVTLHDIKQTWVRAGNDDNLGHITLPRLLTLDTILEELYNIHWIDRFYLKSRNIMVFIVRNNHDYFNASEEYVYANSSLYLNSTNLAKIK